MSSEGGSVSLAIIHCRQNGDLNTGIGNGDEMELELGETSKQNNNFSVKSTKNGTSANYRIEEASLQHPKLL